MTKLENKIHLGHRAFAFVTVFALLAGGCAHDHRHENWGAMRGRPFQPPPPVFLTGPVGELLANAGGYTAKLKTSSAPGSHLQPAAGQLIASGSKFFFQPESISGKQGKAGQLSFIWDVTSHMGYVLSEALQGYAPITSTRVFTNIAIQAAQIQAETFEGHPVELSTATISAGNGDVSRFAVTRFRDLGGLPIRIESIGEKFTLTLSQIRPGPPPAQLFLPPEGFTSYASAEAMMEELDARLQGDVHRGESRGAGDGVPSGGGKGRHSRGGAETGP